MTFRQQISSILIAAVAAVFPTSAWATERPKNLKCEALTAPLAIDNTTPHLSWITPLSHNGECQTACQILVATTPQRLKEGKADLWDSGRMATASHTWVAYGGRPLQSRSRAYWMVRTWDELGSPSPWSEPSSFGIGLLSEDCWQGRFIYLPTAADDVATLPLLRKSFDVKNSKAAAILHINTLGFHEIYVNGQRVGDDVLSPAYTESGLRSMVMTYDVGPMLRKGRNEIVLWLGKGWYNEGLPGVTKGGPFVRAQIDQQQTDGSWTTLVATDASWQAAPSGYTTSWKRRKLGGDVVDARLAPADMTARSLAAMAWQQAAVATNIPQHLATPQMVEPNKIIREIEAKAVVQVDDTTWYYDMGENITGWVRVKLPRLMAGQQVRITYADHLEGKKFRANSNFDLYTANGRQGEEFSNKFNYHGFRYVKLANLPQAPALTDVVAMPIRNAYDGKSTFACSDLDLNNIHNMVQRTFEALTQGGNMVDCPHIERLGYGGDGNASLVSFQTMYNTAPFYNHWLQAWGDCQRPDGSLPYTAPNPNREAGGGPYWCAFFLQAAWQSYVNNADRRPMEQHYDAMKRWLSYTEQHYRDGLLDSLPEKWYLGDWATPKWRTDVVPTDKNSVSLVNNCVMVQCYETMARISTTLGFNHNESEVYLGKANALRQRIHQHFYNASDSTYVLGAQTEMIYPMLVGATAAADHSAVFEKMKSLTATHFARQLVTTQMGDPLNTE